MGKPVTVDSDDLEVLLQAAVAARKIEDVISSVANDPVTIRLRAKGKIAESLDRVNQLRGWALRDRDDLIDVAKLKLHNQDNIDSLIKLRLAGPMGMQCSRSEMDAVSRLRDQRLVVMGQCNELVTWGDKTESAEAMMHLRCKITERGLQWLKEHGHG